MSTPSVLVVDPNPATFRRVEEAFHDAGYGLLSARDAREAEDRANGAELALVLSAASLPRGNGYDLARRLRDGHPAATVLLMTGGFEVFNRERARDAGVAGHITKPFTPDRLRSAVEEIIGPLPGAPAALPADSVVEIEADEAPDREGGDAAEAEGARSETAAADPSAENGLADAAPPEAASAGSAPPPLESAPPPARYRPPASDERVATIIPRDYQEVPLVQVDPQVVAPQLERAILEVLPEVVEVMLRHAVATSPAFRDLVAGAVRDAVRADLPDLVRRVVRERLAEIEARAVEDDAS